MAFRSSATLLVPRDGNAADDVFVKHLITGECQAVSVRTDGWTGNQQSYGGAVSADGRYVAFASLASDLVANDTNGAFDVFMRDTLLGTTVLVSCSSGGIQGNTHAHDPQITANGRYVAFRSSASNLVPGDTNAHSDIFVRDVLAGETIRVSVGSRGEQSNNDSLDLAISTDGRFIAFTSFATTLAAGISGWVANVFLHDRMTRTTSCISRDWDGIGGDRNSRYPALTSDGRYICFQSEATRLVPGDTNASADIFLYDSARRDLVRINQTPGGGESTGGAYTCDISEDGSLVVFSSFAADLVPGDTNGEFDVFVFDRRRSATSLVSRNLLGTPGALGSFAPKTVPDGSRVVFQSLADDLVAGDTNSSYDVFMHDRGTGSGTTQDAVLLTGDLYLAAGRPASFSWFAAPPRARWQLLVSSHAAGSTIGGHAFGLGPAYWTVAAGWCDARGSGHHTTFALPAAASGRMFYVELGVRDALGGISDSNLMERIVL